MMGYSKISVLAMTAALGTTMFFGANASAQQYSPVSVDSSVQVNWDVADGYGGQPTVPQYLSPTVSRDHIVVPGGDLIFPESKPKSTFLASDQFASAAGAGGYDGGFETVVIDGSGGGNAFPTESEFYGVPGVAAPSPSAAQAQAMMDDGANQTIVLNQPEPTAAPRSKPAAPTTSESSATALTPLTKPAPAPEPTPSVAEPAPEATSSPAPVTETAEEQSVPTAPVAPEIAPIADAPEPPAAPAPDTTQPATEMADTAEPVTEQAAPPAPSAEEAAIPPETTPEPMPAAGSDEYSLGFAAESFELSDAAKSQLDSVIATMGQDENLRIQLQAYAQGDGSNASKARRLSLSRALQVRSYLIDRGVRSTRIDVRALGANVPSGPADRVDIKTVQR